MKPTAKIIVISVLLAFCSTCLANELLVPSQYLTIQSAIDTAFDGDTVLVAPGTYTGPGNRDIDFLGKAITVRSTDPNDPNIVAATIIDCNSTSYYIWGMDAIIDYDTETGLHQGFYFHSGEDANSTVEGFTIIRGYIIKGHTNYDGGGGICCYKSSPKIANCIISGNNAGGIYCSESNSVITNCIIRNNSDSGIYCFQGSSTITNCTISNNKGSGIYCYDSNETITSCTITGNSASGISCYNSSPIVTDCIITGNSAKYYGGGIFCGNGSSIITNCTVTGNTAVQYGGGISCYDSNAIITDCNISGNSAYYGGGMYNSSSSPTLTNCTFIGNNTSRDGGGMYNSSSSPTLTNCTFTGNSAAYDGGGLSDCDGPITNCTITGNSAKHYGGGMYDCRGPITNCTITGNSAKYYGGGLASCTGPITNCIITGNSAAYGGGLERCTGPITNCIITGNSAAYGGGGLAGCRGHIKNCTIANNSANYGGGLYKCDCLASNCIIWDNSPQQIVDIYNTTSVIYSDVQGGHSGLGNIDADPCFVDDANDDYHLKLASPCINTGDPNFIPEPNETDLDGLPRIIGGRIDMGAYEFNHQPVADAGPNQITYAWIDGFADVNLDASASFDDDNDVLDYYWSWTIDDSNYEANGVNPTIKLPVRKHTIELVVDDGIDLSEPDYCTITVIKAVRGRLMLSPRVIETKSCGRWILATLFIPPVPGEKVNIDEPLRLSPTGIEAKYQRFSKYGRPGHSYTFALAYFDKQQVIDALGPGKFEVSVVGEFLSGRFFFGSDTIKILSHKPPHYWH